MILTRHDRRQGMGVGEWGLGVGVDVKDWDLRLEISGALGSLWGSFESESESNFEFQPLIPNSQPQSPIPNLHSLTSRDLRPIRYFARHYLDRISLSLCSEVWRRVCGEPARSVCERPACQTR